jgi:uncharacterized protein (DUF433 family)
LNPRIETDPAIMMGKPVIKGTRITVERILLDLRANSVEEILQSYPRLTLDDIVAVLDFAAKHVSSKYPIAAE